MLDIPPARSVTLESGGSCLIYGHDETVIEAARQLAGHLGVHVVVTGEQDILPPTAMDVPVFTGRLQSVSGHLGAFKVGIDGYAPYLVQARHVMAFGDHPNEAELEFDIIIDLSGGTPLVPGPEKRDGYFHPDPGNPGAVQRVLFDAAELVGTFEKPLYVDYNSSLCAHSRSRLTGCTRCIDACPASAITSAGDTVEIDPHVCGGCGLCASVCPTGAASYEMPTATALNQRVRTLLRTYKSAGGTHPVLLVHDGRRGEELIHASARFGRGLPARVVPLVVNEVTQIGFDTLVCMLAYGAEQVLILVPPERRDEAAPMIEQVELANSVLAGLSLEAPRVRALEIDDPDALDTELWELPALAEISGASFLPVGTKREIFRLALGHLHEVSPAPVDVIDLPPQAPFGLVEVDTEGCTLCLACVSACPTGALQHNPDRPMLRFQESACVQCGLCKTTCPERVITLQPRLNFLEEARQAVVLNEEEPWHCIRCDKPFGTKSSIERIVKQLADRHPMFKDSAMVDRIRMCDDCRVIDQADNLPFAFGTPRRTRTTEDYLREEEEEQAPTEGSS